MLPIPEAEDLVGPFRVQWDPSAALGVPAHITLLYPFLPPAEIDAQEIERLEELFAQVPGFPLQFNESRRWPDVLYLHPSPPELVRALMERLFAAYPQLPPYGGQVAEPTPHLTIAQAPDASVLEDISQQFERAARGRLPIRAEVREASLMQLRNGHWETTDHFPLKN